MCVHVHKSKDDILWLFHKLPWDWVDWQLLSPVFLHQHNNITPLPLFLLTENRYHNHRRLLIRKPAVTDSLAIWGQHEPVSKHLLIYISSSCGGALSFIWSCVSVHLVNVNPIFTLFLLCVCSLPPPEGNIWLLNSPLCSPASLQLTVCVCCLVLSR